MEISNLSKKQKNELTDSFIDSLNNYNLEKSLHYLSFSNLDINHISTQYHLNALMISCIKGEVDLVSKIIAIPYCDPLITNYKGMSSLSYAVKYNQPQIIDFLINDVKIDSTVTIPNYKLSDHGDISMLLYSVLTSNVQIVNLLLHNGKIDPNKSDSDGNTPLLMAIRFNYLDIIESLLGDPRTNPNKGNTNYDNQDTPLTFACILNLEQVVFLLMNNHDIDPNITREDEVSALIIAVNQCNSIIIGYLLEYHNIDINYSTELIGSALYYACLRGDETNLRKLLQHPRIKIEDNEYIQDVISALDPPLYFSDYTTV